MYVCVENKYGFVYWKHYIDIEQKNADYMTIYVILLSLYFFSGYVFLDRTAKCDMRATNI